MDKEEKTFSTNDSYAGYTGIAGQELSAQAPIQAGTNANVNTSSTRGTKNVMGVFNSRSAAEKAVKDLRQQGFSTEEINIIGKQREGDREESGEYNDDITDGTLTGGTIGGIGGLILGAGALAIPGVGPIVAMGPIAAALSGAVAGGVTGGLIDWGIPATVSRRYEQRIAEGGILAVIRTNTQAVDKAAEILRQNGANDVESHDASVQ
ncbi:MAG: hypothetical protein H6Q73_2462 [Firmicutes bacterium]|nr:hypothetical protein [Bacillota bacterium]